MLLLDDSLSLLKIRRVEMSVQQVRAQNGSNLLMDHWLQHAHCTCLRLMTRHAWSYVIARKGPFFKASVLAVILIVAGIDFSRRYHVRCCQACERADRYCTFLGKQIDWANFVCIKSWLIIDRLESLFVRYRTNMDSRVFSIGTCTLCLTNHWRTVLMHEITSPCMGFLASAVWPEMSWLHGTGTLVLNHKLCAKWKRRELCIQVATQKKS